jgi:hypothetical protein
MRKAANTLIICFITLLNIIINTGCWNYRELNDIAIVSGTAIDKNEKNNKYIVTFEIINTKGAKESKNIPDLVTMEGNSIFDAVRNTIEKLARRIYWSHAKVVVINKSIAKEGITPVIDFMYRDAEVRTDIWMLISDDDTAADILKGKDKYHDTISFHIDEAFRNEANISKKEIVSQIVEKARVILTDEKSEMVIDLKPDHLGKLSLKVVTERGAVVAKFVAESEQVKAAIESNMDNLKESLTKQGFSIQGFSVSVGQEPKKGYSEGNSFSKNNNRSGKGEKVMSAATVGVSAIEDNQQKLNPYLVNNSSIDLTA